MSERPPPYWSAQKYHNAYGIKNWYRKRKIMDEDARKAIEWAFCKEHGYIQDSPEINYQHRNGFISKRFQLFAKFAIQYCKNNNYSYE